MFWYENANTRKHISEHSWLSGWVILSILAHLAHLALSYFFLIFSAINTYNCFWFDLTNRKICSDWKQKLGEKWPTLTTFFLTATAAITGNDDNDDSDDNDETDKDIMRTTILSTDPAMTHLLQIRFLRCSYFPKASIAVFPTFLQCDCNQIRLNCWWCRQASNRSNIEIGPIKARRIDRWFAWSQNQ